MTGTPRPASYRFGQEEISRMYGINAQCKRCLDPKSCDCGDDDCKCTCGECTDVEEPKKKGPTVVSGKRTPLIKLEAPSGSFAEFLSKLQPPPSALKAAKVRWHTDELKPMGLTHKKIEPPRCKHCMSPVTGPKCGVCGA